MSTASARVDSPVPARAAVESLLRARKLDRTLTSSRLPEASEPGVPFDIRPLDAYLQGGVPAGQLSEVVGPPSSGRTSVVWQWLAAATRRGDTAALVDTFDRFDPESAAACGIDLDRLLWVRGQAISKTGGAVDPVWLPGVRTVEGPGTMVERTVDRAIKALNLVLQSGVCPVVVIDMADVPPTALRRIPYTTWLRLQRVIEGGDTTCVVLAPEPLARSAGGVPLPRLARGGGAPAAVAGPGRRSRADAAVATHAVWRGAGARARRFDGLRFDVRVSSSRRQAAGRVSLAADPRADRRWAER
ncbi:MAG: hypothetical protein AB7U83_16015 [Vicinamibacterales bacterium]